MITTRKDARAGMIALVALACAAAAAPALGAKADLTVSDIAGVPASAGTGEAPALKVTVKNKGTKESKRSPLIARVVGVGDAVVADKLGKGSVGSIQGGRKRQVKFRPKIPYEAIGSFRLEVCVAPGKAANDCARTGAIMFSDGSTIGRIEAALEAGDLSEGEALLMKLYALSGDKRLPGEYEGGGPIPAGLVLADVASAYATLPEAEQAAVEPYLLQPRYAESAWAPGWTDRAAASKAKRRGVGGPCGSTTELNGAWNGIEGTHAVFWHEPGNASARSKAQSLSGAFEASVWPDLTSAFVEVDDGAASSCDPVGDAKIDVYIASAGSTLIPENAGGVAPVLPFTNCGPNPSFIVLPQNAKRWDLAHEFMHVIQAAYPVCAREPAWVEGTATWAGHYVFEGDNEEHRYKGSLTTPFFSLRDQMLNYDSWPFWLSLETNDDVNAIVRVFEALGSTGFAGALEQGPSDGLEEAWKRYAVERWNQVPIGSAGFPLSQSFKQADGFSAKPGGVPSLDIALGGAPERPFQVTTFDQRPLSTWFNRVKITERAVREIEFENANIGRPGAVVQAFLKLKSGQWRLEDWSDKATVKLCRDEPEEDVEELIVATSNASATGNPLGVVNHPITAREICEPPTYTGTYSGTTRQFDPGGGSYDLTTNFNGTLTLTPQESGAGVMWEITAGSLNVTSFDGTVVPCTLDGGGSFTLPATNMVDAPAMVLTGGRYYLQIPWAQFFPPETIGVTGSGPPGQGCENIDEWPLDGVGQFLTQTPGGIEPDENGHLSVANVDFDGGPGYEHDDFAFHLTPDD